MATTAQLIDQAIRRLSELSTTAPVHWTREDLLEYLIEAVNELNLIAGELQSFETIPSVINVNVYTLSVSSVAPLAIRINGKYLAKEPVDDLDNEYEWESISAIRKDVKTWCPLGNNKIVIAPRPYTNPTPMIVEELIMHPPITDGTMNLSIRPEYEPAIEDYMVHRAMFREGGPELNQVEPFYGRFIESVQQLSGKNIIRRYPSWEVTPETKIAESNIKSPGGRE